MSLSLGDKGSKPSRGPFAFDLLSRLDVSRLWRRTPAPGSPAKLPAKVAPWLAVIALAALWPRKKPVIGPPEPPKPLTPADYAAAEPGRGRDAPAPWKIPPLGWKDIFWRTYRQVGRDRLPALAGGVTFPLLLATFPALAAFASLYGMVFDVAAVERQLDHLSAIFPHDVVALLGGQMVRLAAQRPIASTAAFAISTLLSVWSANAGMKALFDALNVIYGETEKRDYVRRTLITYSATLAGLLFLTVVTAVMVGTPIMLRAAGVVHFGFWWTPFRWLVVYLVAALAFSLLYRFGPSRAHARWRWVAGGGALAALMWMIGSMSFSWYVNNFTHLGLTYGYLGAMVAFMLWAWFSVMVMLTGAEFNSEIEHQTACDTTTGEVKPVGERGAAMADNLGKAFTVSPREAVDYGAGFARRQVGYVANFLRRAVGML